MQSMCPAESAILLRLHTIRMRLFVLRHIVIATLALRAGKCDLGTHDFHLRLLRNLHKKNTFSCQLVNYSIIILARQRFFPSFLLYILPPHIRARKNYILCIPGMHPFYIEETPSSGTRNRPFSTDLRLIFCVIFS